MNVECRTLRALICPSFNYIAKGKDQTLNEKITLFHNSYNTLST